MLISARDSAAAPARLLRICVIVFIFSPHFPPETHDSFIQKMSRVTIRFPTAPRQMIQTGATDKKRPALSSGPSPYSHNFFLPLPHPNEGGARGGSYAITLATTPAPTV